MNSVPKLLTISPLLVITLSPEETRRYRKAIPAALYPAGQTLFYQGHYACGAYVIHEGKIELRTRLRSRASVQVAGPQTLLGFVQLIESLPYAYTANVIQDARISFIEKTIAQEWLEHADLLLPKKINLPKSPEHP